MSMLNDMHFAMLKAKFLALLKRGMLYMVCTKATGHVNDMGELLEAFWLSED